MKTINYEIKNILDEINKRSAISQEDISELADNTIKLFKGKHGGGGKESEKERAKHQQIVGKFQVALIEVYLKFLKEGEVGSIFKDIMAKIFPNLIF